VGGIMAAHWRSEGGGSCAGRVVKCPGPEASALATCTSKVLIRAMVTKSLFEAWSRSMGSNSGKSVGGEVIEPIEIRVAHVSGRCGPVLLARGHGVPARAPSPN